MGEAPQTEEIISKNNHSIFKILRINRPHNCLKIFVFEHGEAGRAALYRDHFEHVKEWIRMRFGGRSMLHTLERIELNYRQQREHAVRRIELRAETQYIPFPNLYDYLERQLRNGASIQKQKMEFYLYYTQSLFEVILRGGSIPDFLYTPKNIFFNRPPRIFQSQSGTFYVNFLSTVGLDLLFLGNKITDKDLAQIFPLLPSNLKELRELKDRRAYRRQVNRITKMKALAWNILCFIIGYVPDILIMDDLDGMVSLPQVFELLEKHQREKRMKTLLDYHKKELESITEETGVRYYSFFVNVLVGNCNGVTWDIIYESLFLQHLLSQQAKKHYQGIGERVRMITGDDPAKAKETVSRYLLRQLWAQDISNEDIRKFYEDRSINGGGMVYFLVRANIGFKKMMRHLNILEFIDKTSFCDDLIKVHLIFIENSLRALPGLKAYRIPYSGIPLPSNFAQNEVNRLFNRLSRPHEMASSLSRQVRSQQSILPLQHFSINTLNQLQYSLFRSE